MNKQLLAILMILTFAKGLFAQQRPLMYTSDIDNFWTAYDSIQKESDFSRKIAIINSQYINKGTKGLRAFMEVRQYSDTLWVKLIEQYPKFWNSIRQNTLSVKNKTPQLEQALKKLKQIYPELKEAEMYFTVGGLRSGGTLKGNLVLVGTEIATGSATTDVSEFKDEWLKNVFKDQSLDNIVSLNIHEYIHTQQKGRGANLLSHAIREGSCDFIAELCIQKPLITKYLNYGSAHAITLKESFKKEMYSDNFSNWLYNGGQRSEDADLGYYIGYEICKAYYQQAKHKKQAIKDIITLDYSNEEAVDHFLEASKFYPSQIDKKAIIETYEKLLPSIIDLSPFNNGELEVDPNVKELKITFSTAMMPKNYSISLSPKGEECYPISSVKGYENEDKTLVLSLLELKPQRDYEFIITNRRFKSREGYPLKQKEYLIKFRTK